MIFQKNKVYEDLERIRNANLTPEQIEAYNKHVISKHHFFSKSKGNNLNNLDNYYMNENGHSEKNKKLELERNDILAMILAIFSLILPYILVFIAIMCSFVMLMYYLF